MLLFLIIDVSFYYFETILNLFNYYLKKSMGGKMLTTRKLTLHEKGATTLGLILKDCQLLFFI